MDAAFTIVRTKGFAATSIDDLCQAAGVSKGAFFHHFASKDELGVEAARRWAEVTSELFANAPYHAPDDPLDRFMAYLDFRMSMLGEAIPDFTCLVGTMVQETYDTSPAIRAACEASISGHAQTLEADIAEAMARYGVKGDWTPASLALHTQAVLQGAFILAKAKGGAEAAAASIEHLKRYVALLFNPPVSKGGRP